MKTTVSAKGQIVLPAALRRRDRIEPGQELEVQRIRRGEYKLIRRDPPANQGVIAWLLACPERQCEAHDITSEVMARRIRLARGMVAEVSRLARLASRFRRESQSRER